ncbi:hypothetical protein KC950_02865 [Candidatus Saccharibacteria bacterium]|nr:hypothetical protein [Candidatus Saccharibacteria bacterium]
MNRKPAVLGVLLIAVVGASYLILSSAAPASDCGSTTVEDYSYNVPFGNAVWNQKVCGLERHSKSDDYANRLLKYSYINKVEKPEEPKRYITNNLGFGPNFATTEPEIKNSFGRNVYYASDATTTTQVWAYHYGSNLDEPKREYKPDATIPWNPEWKTGQGGDNEIVILDENSGRIYELANYQQNKDIADLKCVEINWDYGIFDLTFPDSGRICVGSAYIGRDINGNIIDYRTFEGLHGDRGAGFSKFITFTMPDEILAGEIRHAMGVAIPNNSIGPICTKEQQETDAEGYTCGTALAPATKVEHGDKTNMAHVIDGNAFPQTLALYTQDKLIPEGMRFALDISNDEIDAWIQSRDDLRTNPRQAETARIIAVALRDYGVIPVDTSGYGPGIQVAGSENPDSRSKWEQLGFTKQNVGGFLRGLITEENLYVVEPPTVICNDGSITKYHCSWIQAYYPGQTSPGKSIKLEAESGTPASGADIINDPSASGSGAIQF